VATFGDSFTYGQQATNEQAWGNRLAERLNCRVANYGVPGYGVDQAYLRYGRKRAKIASASVVVIGFFPENIMRHVNQYVGFRVGRPNLLFKPRFVSDDGSLQLHPPISREVFDENKLNESPAELLPHEFFLPGSRYGPVPASFPYSLAAVRALMHPRVIASIRGRPSWIDLYQSERDSEPRDLTGKLIEAFARDVESSGKAPLVFVFANASSVRTFLETNEWPYQPILSFLAEIGIPYLHFGTKLAETYGENVCDVFMKETLLGCTGHYTPEGYAMVAEMIAGRLRATRLVSPRPR
jgi:lysophospholipase L1-like esterase